MPPSRGKLVKLGSFVLLKFDFAPSSSRHIERQNFAVGALTLQHKLFFLVIVTDGADGFDMDRLLIAPMSTLLVNKKCAHYKNQQ